MYLTKLIWDKASAAYTGTIGFGKIPVTLSAEGDKFILRVAGQEFCGLYKKENGNFSGSWSLMRVVLSKKPDGALSLMFFEKEKKDVALPEGYKEPDFS